MKIILENEMEKKAWSILLSAHYKWEKNHGDSINNQMKFYFYDLFKDETEKIIEEEVKSRLNAVYGDLNIVGVSKEQYVKGVLDDAPYEVKEEVEGEYDDLISCYEYDKESIPGIVKQQLFDFHYELFNAPELLVVESSDGEIIQKGREEEK